MIRIFICFSVVLSVFLSGCQNGNQKAGDPNAVQVVLIGTNTFPKELVGRWKADRADWEIEFAKNGAVISIVHTLGAVEIEAGKEAEVPLINKGKGIVRPGKWTVEYDDTTKTLSVEIKLDYFNFHKLTDTIEGKSRDLFVGPLSEDGKQWKPLWQTYPEYIVSTDVHNKLPLPIDEESRDSGMLIFQKVESVDGNVN